MARRPQPGHVSWPLTPTGVENIEKCFRTLFQDMALTDLIPVSRGGTGLTTFAAGDILYASATDVLAGLTIDTTAGRFLRTTGSLPAWSVLVLPNAATTGDLLYANASNVIANLADVATGNALISGGVGVAPSWGKIGLTTHVSGILPVANGGTAISSYAIGDLLYASGATTLSRLADIATGNALLSGGVSAAPLWGKIGLTTHVSGTLPVANGGTGTATAFTAGSIVFAGASGVYAQDNANFFWDDTNNRLGIGTTSPSFPLHVLVASGSGAIISESTNTAIAPLYRQTNANGHSWHFSVFGALDRFTIARSGVADVLQFANDTSPKCVLFDNGATGYVVGIGIGTTGLPTSGSSAIVFGDGVALSGMASNTAGLYADDVNGTTELFGINESGNVAQLTGLTIRKTADESVTNSITHQADDHLTVNLAASSSYAFEIWGFWTTAGATAGISIQLDGTVGISSLKADVAIIDYVTNAFSAYGRITAFNSATGSGLTGDNAFFIKGVIETTTAGTLLLEWAQNTADALNATTVQENSYFLLRKLNA